MKKNSLKVSLFVLAMVTLSLAGCSKSDYSEGNTPAAAAPKTAVDASKPGAKNAPAKQAVQAPIAAPNPVQ